MEQAVRAESRHLLENLARVRADIAHAAVASGRRIEDIKLIAVSKTKPTEFVQIAAQVGQFAFAENTVQEATKKIPLLGNLPLEWHLIGHLQSNKARKAAALFRWIHSLDSLDIALKLEQAAPTSGLDCLVQVNLSGEPSKHGCAAVQLPQLLESLLTQRCQRVRLRGLMTIARNGANEHETRSTFSALRELRDQMAHRYRLTGFDQLSMGMSGDYRWAVAEGATLLRVGSAIFGQRQYAWDQYA